MQSSDVLVLPAVVVLAHLAHLALAIFKNIGERHYFILLGAVGFHQLC
jgi:hypothetical protein